MAEEISQSWKQMLKEDKVNVTKDALVDLRERRANREIGRHNPGAVAAQDPFLAGERVRETVSVYDGSSVIILKDFLVAGTPGRSHRR